MVIYARGIPSQSIKGSTVPKKGRTEHMKQRLLALLLAGLLAASAVACKTNSENPNNNPAVTTTQRPGGPQDPNTPVVDSYRISNDTVYAIHASVPLYASDSDSASVVLNVPFKTELNRSKYNSTWSVINYGGNEYYTKNSNVAADDIAQKSFQPLDNEQMHVAESGYKLRKYPTQINTVNGEDNFAGNSLAVGTNVWAVAKNKDWYEIKLNQNDSTTCFISAKALGEGKAPTLADLGDYQSKYPGPAATTTTTYYVVVESLTIRERPSAYGLISPDHGTLKKDAEVQVTAIATVNGEKWAEIRILDEKLGVNKHYFVSADCISLTKGGPVANLNDIIAANPLFKAYTTAQIMYVDTEAVGGLNLRTAPIVNDDNLKDNVATGTELKVVAYGTDDKLSWCIVLYNSQYYFASTDYLTPHGQEHNYMPILSLSEAVKKNANLSTITEKTLTVKEKIDYFSDPDIAKAKDMGDLAVGDTVIVVGSGRVNGIDLYIIRHNGGHYFIVNNPAQVG